MTRTLNIKSPGKGDEKALCVTRKPVRWQRNCSNIAFLMVACDMPSIRARRIAPKKHAKGRWHGHPVGWVEVPANLRWQWVKEKRVEKDSTG